MSDGEEANEGQEFVDDDGGSVDDSSAGDAGPVGKLCGSLGLMCVGIVALPLALYLLGWNESHYACKNARILYAEAKATEVPCDSTKVMNQFAFFSCPLVQSSLQLFAPCVFNPMKMDCATQPPISFRAASGRQVVEMYQCLETCETSNRKNTQGQTVSVRTCSYRMDWSPHQISSWQFKHSSPEIMQGCPGFSVVKQNPTFPEDLQPGTTSDYAQTVLAGEGRKTSFTLNHRLVEQLAPEAPVELAPFAGNFSGPPSGGVSPWTRPFKVSGTNLRVSGNALESCIPPYQIGCTRIQYFQSKAVSTSVLTHVSDAGETAPQTVPGSWGCSAEDWQEIRAGKVSKEELIASLREDSKTEVWLLRICGCLGAMLAIFCCLRPISATADVVGDMIRICPCGGWIEELLEGIVDWVICVISCNAGCACSLFTIAVVWIFMRPLYGIGLMVVGVCCCAGSIGARQSFAPDKLDSGRGVRDLDMYSNEEGDPGMDAGPVFYKDME